MTDLQQIITMFAKANVDFDKKTIKLISGGSYVLLCTSQVEFNFSAEGEFQYVMKKNTD